MKKSNFVYLIIVCSTFQRSCIAMHKKENKKELSLPIDDAYKAFFPSDCTIRLMNKVGKKISITLFAHDHYSIGDAQKIVISKIIDHTRDFTKRTDGALDPDHMVSCEVLFFQRYGIREAHPKLIENKRAADVWYDIEDIMRKKLAELKPD